MQRAVIAWGQTIIHLSLRKRTKCARKSPPATISKLQAEPGFPSTEVTVFGQMIRVLKISIQSGRAERKFKRFDFCDQQAQNRVGGTSNSMMRSTED